MKGALIYDEQVESINEIGSWLFKWNSKVHIYVVGIERVARDLVETEKLIEMDVTSKVCGEGREKEKQNKDKDIYTYTASQKAKIGTSFKQCSLRNPCASLCCMKRRLIKTYVHNGPTRFIQLKELVSHGSKLSLACKRFFGCHWISLI